MQAVIPGNKKVAARRKLHIGLHLEIGLTPISEMEPHSEPGEPLERAYHRQQLEQQISAERDAAYRRIRLAEARLKAGDRKIAGSALSLTLNL
jgi:hypothetical protein